MPKYEDFLLCAITTQLHQFIKGFDVLIDERDSKFSETGLKTTSVIRLGSLAVMSLSHLAGSIGQIQPNEYNTLIENLTNYLRRN